MTLQDQLKLLEVEEWPEEKRQLFQSIREQGNSISMSHLLASKKMPKLGGNMNSSFGEAMRHKMDSMTKLHRSLIMRRAKRAGVRNPESKYLLPGFRPENPEGWVTDVDEAASAFKRNKLNAEGVVNVQTVVDEPPPKPVKLAPDIVNRIAAEKIQQDPKLQETVTKNPKKIMELKEQVVEEHGNPNC